jgi:hypothetical protein
LESGGDFGELVGVAVAQMSGPITTSPRTVSITSSVIARSALPSSIRPIWAIVACALASV